VRTHRTTYVTCDSIHTIVLGPSITSIKS